MQHQSYTGNDLTFGQFFQGIEYVGYAIGACGVGSIIASCGIGAISNVLPRWVIILIGLLTEIATCLTLLTWEPIEVI